MKKSFLARLRSLALSQMAALLVLAPIVSSHAAVNLISYFDIEHEDQGYYSGTVTNSLGSGVTYWRTRDKYLLLDNTVATWGVSPNQVTGTRIVEFNRDHSVSREIILVGFQDPEDIHWLYGDTFVIAQEHNTGPSPDATNELVVINLPTSGTSVNISTATRRMRFPSIALNSNKGIEAVVLLGSSFYFTTEKAPTPADPSTWKVWTAPFLGNGNVTPTVAFTFPNPMLGSVKDISGMATDGKDLWLLSNEGTGTEGSPVASILQVKTDGTLVAHYVLPGVDGDTWRQAEGIELFMDPVDLRLKILLAGEIGTAAGGTGVDFMLLKAPGVKLATTGTAGDGWLFYPFLNGGGSQYYVTTASAINTTGLTDPAPQAVYQKIQPEFSTLTVNGLSPTTAYRVRVHLSSVEFTGWQNVLQDVWVSNGGSPNWAGSVTPYGAGGFNQAMIVDLGTMYPSYPGYSGVFFVGITPSAPGKTVVVNGIEIWPDP